LIWRILRSRGSAGGWRALVDDSLQAHVLAEPEVLVERRWPMLAACAALVVATLALAGPTWERLPVPAFRSEEALVVALDLSRSMDATDVEPSRLTRAKLKLLSLLDRRAAGQTALVVFSAHAFTVTPLTSDTRTIGSLVTSLSTDIMPSRGSYAEAGLDRAARLLRQSGMNQGEILLISDADVSPDAVDLVRDLRSAGIRVHVLAVGTEQGAPIAEPGGGFLTDGAGQVVIPRLDTAALRRLAEAGGGRFALLASDERDLDSLFPPRALGASGATLEQSGDEYQADVWRDQGLWLALALLPLLALGFRRGWICALLIALVAPFDDARAFEWRDLWQRPDQRGIAAMQSEQPARAAELFDDPAWRGAAEYRAGEFSASAATLAGVDSADGHYNRGNALAKAGQLRPAIEAYERALERDPEHADARYNRELLENYLKENPEQDQSGNGEQGQGGEQQRSSSGASAQDESGEGDERQASDDPGSEQSDSQGQEPGAQQSRGGQSQADRGQGERDDDSLGTENADEPADADQPRQADAGGEQIEQAGDAPSPDDVEQWASEQAAEQWLRRVPQDPGGLLRRKFLYQYQRLGVDQDGNYVWPGDEEMPW
jgi:Ca-activated chloride channel family protein